MKKFFLFLFILIISCNHSNTKKYLKNTNYEVEFVVGNATNQLVFCEKKSLLAFADFVTSKKISIFKPNGESVLSIDFTTVR